MKTKESGKDEKERDGGSARNRKLARNLCTLSPNKGNDNNFHQKTVPKLTSFNSYNQPQNITLPK